MTRLFLHAGTHKTGTTAIQTFAMRHRAALLDRGLLFPTLEPDLPGRSMPHHVLAHTVAGQRTGLDLNRIPDLVARWRETAEKAGAAVLISAEPIYRHVLSKGPDEKWTDGRRRYLKRLARLLAPFDVEPVLVFRRPEDFARSSFQERVMKSSSAPWGSFAEFRDQAIDIRKYFRNAKILQAVFGTLRAMTFEDLTEGGPVPQNFFRALGVDVSDLDDGGVVRESLGPRETAVKLALIRRSYPPDRNAAVLDWLRAPDTTARIDAIFGPGPFGIWESAAALEVFRAQTAPQVERLRAGFFPDRAALFPAPRAGAGPDPVPDHPAGLDGLLGMAPVPAMATGENGNGIR
jgi:hypothetical protein